MIVDTPGGGAPFDLASIEVHITLPAGWDDPVEWRLDEVVVPGREDAVELSDPQALPRDLRLAGWLKGADKAALRARLATLKTQLDQPNAREISFPEDDPDIIAVGKFTAAELRRIRPYWEAFQADVILLFHMADPRRYDISGGRPGVALP